MLCINRKVRSGVTRSKTCQNSSGCGQNAAPSAAVGCQICYNILALGRRPGWRQTAVNTAAIILASSNLATRQPDDLDEITAQLPTWMRVVQFPPSALKKGNKLDWCPLWCHRIRRKKDKLSNEYCWNLRREKLMEERYFFTLFLLATWRSCPLTFWPTSGPPFSQVRGK